MNNQILRGDVYMADLGGVLGSEQGGIRPVIIIQNDMGNYHSPTTIIAPITTKLNKSALPTHIKINKNTAGLDTLSMAMLEQIRVIDKLRLLEKKGTISHYEMQCLNKGLLISIGILIHF